MEIIIKEDKDIDKFISVLKEEVTGNIGIIKKLNCGKYPEEIKKKMINDICEHLDEYLNLATVLTK